MDTRIEAHIFVAFLAYCLQVTSKHGPSERCYQSVLDYHLFPDLGDVLLSGITPLHIENLVRKKEIQKLSPKSIRNILVVFQGIFNVALDNDLMQRSPIRKSHRPDCKRFEKTAWTAEQLKLILDNVPPDYSQAEEIGWLSRIQAFCRQFD